MLRYVDAALYADTPRHAMIIDTGAADYACCYVRWQQLPPDNNVNGITVEWSTATPSHDNTMVII